MQPPNPNPSRRAARGAGRGAPRPDGVAGRGARGGAGPSPAPACRATAPASGPAGSPAVAPRRDPAPPLPTPGARRLTRSTGLERLSRLEALSLADNYLTALEGLGGLAALRCLDAARNDVAALGGALDGCAALRRLNLAANRVASFEARRRRGRRLGRRRGGPARACGGAARTPRRAPAPRREPPTRRGRRLAAPRYACALSRALAPPLPTGAAGAVAPAGPRGPLPVRPAVGRLPRGRPAQLPHPRAVRAAGAGGARPHGGRPGVARGGGDDARQEAGEPSSAGGARGFVCRVRRAAEACTVPCCAASLRLSRPARSPPSLLRAPRLPRPPRPQLYYGMRAQLLRRHAEDLAARGELGLSLLRGRWAAAQRRLERAAAQLRRLCLGEAQAGAGAGAGACLRAADAAAARLRARRAAAEAAFAAAARRARRLAAAAGERLEVELRSGGNARLEEGCPADAWFGALEALLSERLGHVPGGGGGGDGGGGGSGPWGVTGLRLLSALRVHNRGLKARFDEEGGDGGAPAPAEFLFAGEGPDPGGLHGAAGPGSQKSFDPRVLHASPPCCHPC
jgi:hypothetical protein